MTDREFLKKIAEFHITEQRLDGIDGFENVCKEYLNQNSQRNVKEFNRDSFISGFLCAGGELKDAEMYANELEKAAGMPYGLGK